MSRCSTCPVLDLEHEYEPNDPNDPWRRMPRVFNALGRYFGGAFYSRTSRTRRMMVKLVSHYCRVQRQKYGPCNRKRMRVCAGVILDAVEQSNYPGVRNRHAMFRTKLELITNADETHEAMLQTIPKPTFSVGNLLGELEAA